MKKVLFINGCVRGEHSRTLRLAQTYLAKLREKEKLEPQERNLSEEKLNFLTYKDFDRKTGEVGYSNISLAQEFAAADEIIVAAPFWEFLFPAVVSTYLEMISIAGITFKYTATGSVGLCRAQSLTYIYSVGAYLTEEDKLCEKYMQKLTTLYGIPEFHVIAAEGLDIDPTQAETIVKEVCQKIKG